MNQTSLTASHPPHIIKKGQTTQRIMLDVIIALVPAMIAAVFFFGYLVLINIFACVLFCMMAELLYNLIISKKWNMQGIKDSSITDFSCMVTGVILALNLPTFIEIFGWHITNNNDAILFSFDTIIACLVASMVAIIVTKMLFGGIGKNFANPAAVGRIFLVLAFAFTAVNNSDWLGGKSWAMTGATYLSEEAVKSEFSIMSLLIGATGSAAVGETCALAILLGGIYLCIKRVIDFRLPLMVLISAALFHVAFSGLPNLLDKNLDYDVSAMLVDTLKEILAGGLVFGAVFMATDYATSPNTFLGNMIYAFGIGLFTILIRKWADMPEGFSFALIIMNITVPIIDKYIINKPFGNAKNKRVNTVESKNISVGG